MSLRIIGGECRGRKLYAPPGKATRPTPEIVREALFNILSGDILGSRFLDLFAGSGAVGLEALSRGAAQVTFVEKSPGAQRVLRKNLALLDCPGRFRLVSKDAFTYEAISEEDFIFAAPPYEKMDRMGRLARHLNRFAAPEVGWVLQHPKGFDISEIELFWATVETRIYGNNALSFFRKAKESQPASAAGVTTGL